MRFLISFVGVLASLILLASSASMNYLFMYSLGKTELNSQILSAASVGADILKALLPFFISWAYLNARYAFAFAGSFMFVGLVGLSLLSASSFILGSRAAVSGTLDEINADYRAAQADLKSSKTKLDSLSQIRASNLIAADINRAKRSRRWRATAKCTNATLPASQKFCEKLDKLQDELGKVTQKKRLEFKISRLTKEINQLREAGAGQDGDPQVGLLSRVFDIERDGLTLTINFFIAIVIELGSDLGIFFATSWGAKPGRREESSEKAAFTQPVEIAAVNTSAQESEIKQIEPIPEVKTKPKSKRKTKAKPATPKKNAPVIESAATPDHITQDNVEDDGLSRLMVYCLDRLHPDFGGTPLTVIEIYADFENWNEVRGEQVVSFTTFKEQFTEIAKHAGIAIEGGECLNLRIGNKKAENIAL